ARRSRSRCCRASTRRSRSTTSGTAASSRTCCASCSPPDRTARADRPSAGPPDGWRSRLHSRTKGTAEPVLQSDLTSRTDPRGGGLPAFPRLLLSGGIAFVACLLAKLISFDASDLLLVWPCAGVAFAFAWRNGPGWAVPPAIGGALWAWVE